MLVAPFRLRAAGGIILLVCLYALHLRFAAYGSYGDSAVTRDLGLVSILVIFRTLAFGDVFSCWNIPTVGWACCFLYALHVSSLFPLNDFPDPCFSRCFPNGSWCDLSDTRLSAAANAHQMSLR